MLLRQVCVSMESQIDIASVNTNRRGVLDISHFTIETLPLNFSGLFPLNFGESAGDHFGPTGDDSASDLITLPFPLTFFGTEYTKIIVRPKIFYPHYLPMLYGILLSKVNSNGVLSFGGEHFLFFRPAPFPSISTPLVAPFWHDFNPARGGSISYRQTNDSNQLLLVHRLLVGQTFADFYPVLLFVTTWYQVPQYNGVVNVSKFTIN